MAAISLRGKCIKWHNGWVFFQLYQFAVHDRPDRRPGKVRGPPVRELWDTKTRQWTITLIVPLSGTEHGKRLMHAPKPNNIVPWYLLDRTDTIIVRNVVKATTRQLTVSTRKQLNVTIAIASRWRHYGHDSVSNHQPHHCLLNRLFGCRWKNTSKLRITGLCKPVNSPHKWPVTHKMFPFDDVIMRLEHKNKWCCYYNWRVGQGRRSNLRHAEGGGITQGNGFSSFKSTNSDLGVVQSCYECLTLGHLNIRSLLPEIDEIRNVMSVSNFDIIAVCETWANYTMMDSKVVNEGYQVYREDRFNSNGGGVRLYLKNEYNFTVCHDRMFNDVEALWGELNVDSQKLLMSVIYRS